MPRHVSPRTTLDNLRREAKRWLNAIRAGLPDARERYDRAVSQAPSDPTLRDVQHALALEHGLPGWSALKRLVGRDDPLQRYERVAAALVTAYDTADPESMRTVWHYFGHGRTWEAMRRYVRLDLGRTQDPAAGEVDTISLDDARSLVARAQGFESWTALADFTTAMPVGQPFTVKAVALGTRNDGTLKLETTSRDWDQAIALMRERRLSALGAFGQMTDAVLARLSRLDHITTLDLSGSAGLTDEGLAHLARLTRLDYLDLSGCRVSDKGLAVLRSLPALETIKLAWTSTSDEGASHLAACERLRSVDLGGTPSGDGAIRALAGKPALSDFRSGDGVTDEGLSLLREVPVFRSWQGGEQQMALLSPDAEPNYLLLRGPFTDDGMRHLAQLEGLFALNLDNDRLRVTGASLAHLKDLPHLSWLAFDAKDDSMPFIAALPRLRFLMCQDTTAGDEGFVALGRSQSIEKIWGRRCYNLRRRGFIALSSMPSLRSLSVSCRNVDDEGLAALPRFPSLVELMPMDVPDAGYRHVGACAGLESLVLMYCRDTTDVATTHITGLTRLKRYFASYNRITDLTPEILSGMSSLESVEFDSCAGLTNAGVAQLARLPHLRILRVSGMPGVTGEVKAAFPPHVHVHHQI